MDFTKRRIGIIGGGQLGKMMILEAKRLDLYVVTLDPCANCPSHNVSDKHIVAGFDDAAAFRQLSEMVDVITYEFEHIDAGLLAELEDAGHTIYPSVAALKIIQNKFLQKTKLKKAGLPMPRFALIKNAKDLEKLARPENFDYPLMLKTTTGGYDGKGNFLIRNADEIETAFQTLGGDGQELMAEEFIDLDKEVSVIACRGIDGSRIIYPVAENIHVNSILDTTIAPARVSGDILEKATDLADQVMEVFHGVGTFCVEMFVDKSGQVLINEVAPRPHNSGHYTIEGCFANQFENHIRAIIGLPFGRVELVQPTVMVNLLGQSDGPAKVLGLKETYQNPNIQVHIYGKSQSKLGRKMGHFTVIDETVEGALGRAEKAKRLIRAIGIPD